MVYLKVKISFMTDSKKHRTDFLFPRASFLTGAGSVLNVAGNYFTFKYSSSGEKADAKALLSDWGVIGQDIIEAEKSLEKELMSKVNEEEG